jgi:hypothetical protein
MTKWAALLRPVMKHFVATFDAPDNKKLKKLWIRVCHAKGENGSGLYFIYKG